jgi:hypothetical protein
MAGASSLSSGAGSGVARLLADAGLLVPDGRKLMMDARFPGKRTEIRGRVLFNVAITHPPFEDRSFGVEAGESLATE